MTPDTMRPRHWARSLRTRLIAFLTIALLPLGIVAVLQTVQVIDEAGRLVERDVLARTERAASDQTEALRRAIGAAHALGAAASALTDNPERCSGIMAEFVAAQPSYVFAGFVPTDGLMTCNNAGTVIDYTGAQDWEAFLENPVRSIEVNRQGDVSQVSVFIVFVPIFDSETGVLLGGQAISLPHGLSEALLRNEIDGVVLALIGPQGQVLATSMGMDNVTAFERLGLVPETLDIPREGLLIRQGPVEGARQLPAAVVPLIRDELYVLGLWSDTGVQEITFYGRTVPLFPLLMWLASLGVAYVSVNNLVLKPLSHLSDRIRRYRAGRQPVGPVIEKDVPQEVMEISEAYEEMVDRVASERAALQDSIAEKETLLREVHHRVKNNLQLISSILNMQMRGVQDDNARRILTRVQDRVMSLSSVHRALYVDDRLQEVRADLLIKEVVDGIKDLVTSGATPVWVEVDLQPVRLDADQAVPLSLLAAEAMTNAAKYVGADGDATPTIDVSLHEDEAGTVAFRVTNTRGSVTLIQPDDPETDGSGLGARLIKSFASQLGGAVEIEVSDAAYDLRVGFTKLPAG